MLSENRLRQFPSPQEALPWPSWVTSPAQWRPLQVSVISLVRAYILPSPLHSLARITPVNCTTPPKAFLRLPDLIVRLHRGTVTQDPGSLHLRVALLTASANGLAKRANSKEPPGQPNLHFSPWQSGTETRGSQRLLTA
jgi:hypothetical protein